MTPAQLARQKGFEANLRIRGRCAFTDTANSNGDPETLTILVEEAPIIPDPSEPVLQKESKVFTTIHAFAGSVKEPRNVGFFFEGTPKLKGRFYKVLEYQESASDAVTWRWACESERLDVVP